MFVFVNGIFDDVRYAKNHATAFVKVMHRILRPLFSGHGV